MKNKTYYIIKNKKSNIQFLAQKEKYWLRMQHIYTILAIIKLKKLTT